MYNQSQNYIGKINNRYEKMQNRWLKGISIFLITENGKIVMEKRGNVKLNPYEDDFCSGHVEEKNGYLETYIQAAYREAEEELGLKPYQVKDLTSIQNPVPLVFKDRKFFIQFFCAKIDSKNITKDYKEVKDYYEEDIEQVIKKLREDRTKFPYRQNKDEIEKIIMELESIIIKDKEQGVSR